MRVPKIKIWERKRNVIAFCMCVCTRANRGGDVCARVRDRWRQWGDNEVRNMVGLGE